jgi:hypothetical protein
MSRTTASSEPERRASLNVTKGSGHLVRATVNWILTVLTVPAALIVIVVGFAGAMGTDRCAYEDCARQGPPISFLCCCFLVPRWLPR